jgi:2-dehydro-3-deoxyphosphogluconate aldolase/(4S)-4-hydroxy-2-oxoglutarate aldolase
MEALDLIRQTRIVPVVVIRKVEDTLPTLAAMLSGSLPIAEITFRTDCAAEAIRLGCATFPDMMIGAGTILDGEQAELAIHCGARFIVGPGFSEEVAKTCAKNRIPYIPGCVTPTEIMTALSHHIDLVKFFPAEAFGGLNALKALSEAFPMISFLPTGGINEKNLKDYLACNRVAACGGSYMMKGSLDDIAAACSRTVKIISSLSVK